MLIIWGTKVRQEPRGVVADKCAVCSEIELFDVTDHYEVSHVYFIPLGSGNRVAATRSCRRCGTIFDCEIDGYDGFLSDKSLANMTVNEVIAQTNAPLAKARYARKKLEEMSHEAPSSTSEQVTLPGTPVRAAPPAALNEDFRKALARLEKYETSGRKVRRLMRRMEYWRSLDYAGRETLLREMEGFIENQEQIDNAYRFIAEIAPSFPLYAGVLSSLAIFGVLAVLFFRSELLRSEPQYSVGFVVFALALSGSMLFYLRHLRQQRWFRNRVVPDALARNIDLPILCRVLTELKESGRRLEERVAGMANNTRMLKNAAIAAGRWNDAVDN
jgi:hypothetical protein